VANFHYRALTQGGEVVSGSITALSVEDVLRQVEYLGLVPIDATSERDAEAPPRFTLDFLTKPSAEDVTTFTRDLALLLKSGARIDTALELLASDGDIGRLRPTVGKVRASIVGGESFAEALSRHPSVFPATYVALVRVGEASGTLDHILEVLAAERQRVEAVRSKLMEAIRYPAFVLFAATCVLTFFLLFVLPNFASVLRDFHAKLDPLVAFFFGLSDLVRHHGDLVVTTFILVLAIGWLLSRRVEVRRAVRRNLTRLPLVKPLVTFHTTALYCCNLGVLLSSGMTLSAALRILVDIMDERGRPEAWTQTMDHVRHGGKLSDALADADVLPANAVRMLRLGEETGQLAMLSGRVAEFYEAKLQRSLDRIVGIAGPAAIMAISVVVGGLIVSIMTSLLSVTQVVG
jgi:general secretion pathway protein F